MPRRRGLILVLLGLVLALGTGALVFLLLQNAAPTTPPDAVQNQPTAVPVKRLPVASRLLEAGTIISTSDIAVQDFPIDTPAVGTITDTTQLVGEQVLAAIQEGEVFRGTALRGASGGPLSNSISPARVVIAFPAGDLLSQTSVITPGDRVDLLLTLDVVDATGIGGETRSGKSTNFTVQNINVLQVVRGQVTEQNPNPAPSALLLELQPSDAVRVKFVKDNGGVIDFALRSRLDTEEFDVEAYNLDNLRDDFGFTAPRSNVNPTPQ
ncbi:MAG: Flp pilus assembly protein CpaB [Chloroflexi bacterium]|nr:MAG: Flp pilus assembly protein CpaB [Chloroflexota bacterium]